MNASSANPSTKSPGPGYFDESKFEGASIYNNLKEKKSNYIRNQEECINL